MRRLLLSIIRGIVQPLRKTGIGKFRFVQAAYDRLISPFKKTGSPVKVFGHKMFLDSEDSLHLSVWGVYGPFETEILKKEVKAGDVVLDIGANIGYHTLLFAERVGEKGKVYAFEPDPDNFSLLEKNVEMNGYKNVILVRKAVSDKAGRLKLYLAENNKGTHHTYDAHEGRRAIEIEAVQIDEYFKDYDGPINFIKMDIEGAEGRAIQGMRETIRKNKSLVLSTEVFPTGLRQAGVEVESYLGTLLEFGFHWQEINEGNGRMEELSVPEFLKRASSRKDYATNLLCRRNQP